MWIRPEIGDGTLFAKQKNSGLFDIYYRIRLSSFIPQLTIKSYDLSAYTEANQVCGVALDNTAWYHLGVTLSIDLANDLSQLTCFIDAVAGSVFSVSSGYLQDLQTDFGSTIGAYYTSGPVFTDQYTGYIYSLKIWNVIRDLGGTE